MNNKILQESADDSILQEDLDRISESDIPLEELKGKTGPPFPGYAGSILRFRP